METINCKHVEQGRPGQEPNGKACRRVAYRNLFYCHAHRHLYLGGETRTEYEKRRKTLSEDDPDYEPPIMKAMLEDPEPRTDPAPEQEPRPLSPDWDELQEEGGWWDTALVDPTSEERKKEALANAEAAKRSLKAEEIYTVASLGGEVTDEMFGRDLSSSIIRGGITGVGLLLAIPILPVVMLFLLAAAFNAPLDGGGDVATDMISSISEDLWKPQFFAISVLMGSLIGFGNHRKRTEALTKGQADFITAFPRAPDGSLIASQEET